MCLSCELFDCAGCDNYEAMPEYGCCCGSIRPEEQDDGQDWQDDDEESQQ